MPFKKVRAPGGGYDIKRADTGKKVGHSTSASKAQRSINARNAGAHGWKPSRKK